MLGNQVKYHQGKGKTIRAKKVQVEIGKPKVMRIDVAAAQESGSAMAMYDGMVILKKLLYHRQEASGPFAILKSIRAIAHGKHSGTKNQLIPPCPEYVKLRPGTIAKANITIGKQLCEYWYEV